jgi:hypothetical protein
VRCQPEADIWLVDREARVLRLFYLFYFIALRALRMARMAYSPPANINVSLRLTYDQNDRDLPFFLFFSFIALRALRMVYSPAANIRMFASGEHMPFFETERSDVDLYEWNDCLDHYCAARAKNGIFACGEY